MGRGGDGGAAAGGDCREFRQWARAVVGRLCRTNGTQEAEAAKAQAAQAAHLARVAAMEADTRRLIEIVRSLAGDRERLLTRLSTIERSLEDVTGSIKQQPAAPTPPAATQPPPAAAAEPPPKTAAVPPQTVAPAEPASAPPPPAPPNRVASVPPAGGMPDLEAIQPRPTAGVDVGGAKDFDGLRTLWNTITNNHYGLFEGLHPIVAVRENSKSRTAELRLVAGPLTDIEIANRICTTLAAAKRYCRLVPFEGQPLALHGTEPPRRPAAKARPTVRTVAP
jgi:hypothetical protein